MLVRLVTSFISRRLSGRSALVAGVAAFVWRKVRGGDAATAVVRVPRGSRVVVHAIRENP